MDRVDVRRNVGSLVLCTAGWYILIAGIRAPCAQFVERVRKAWAIVASSYSLCEYLDNIWVTCFLYSKFQPRIMR